MPKIKKKDSDAYRSAKRVRCAQNQAKERQKQDHNFAGFRFQHARSRWGYRLNQIIWLRLSSVFESRRISFFKIFLVRIVYRVKSGIFGQTAKFGQRPCLFHISNIGIINTLTKQTVNPDETAH